MAQSSVALGFPSGANIFQETVIANSSEAIKASAGTLYYVQVDNSANAGAASFLKLYDTAGAVTVGTTVPDWVIKVAGGAVVNYPIPAGVAFANGLAVACVTAGGTGGTTSPTSSVITRIVYS